MSPADTIFALSSGLLPSGVAVIRVSGPGVPGLLLTMVAKLPEPRRATLTTFRSAAGEALDRGIVLYFPAPSSVTGDDLAELQVHGGRATVAAILSDLSGRAEFRMAESGEFTRRAFLNGRVDLTEVEALADLIAAETESQRRFALSNSAGAQRELYEGWRSRLVRVRALIEAELDFSDEEDVPGSASDAVWGEVRGIATEIEKHLQGFRRGEIVRSGFDVVIVGRPNVGKSSLLNALAKRDVAIVSDEAGTTRDLIEVALDLKGVKVRLTDTAGLREGAERTEALGIARARQRAAEADLILALSDSYDWSEWEGVSNVVRVASRQDVEAGDAGGDVSISRERLDALVDVIADRAAGASGGAGEVLPSRERHAGLLSACKASLELGLQGGITALELRAEHLRRATDSLGRLTGKVDVEDLLDVIFSEFCIGK